MAQNGNKMEINDRGNRAFQTGFRERLFGMMKDLTRAAYRDICGMLL